ncbi:Protein of unknown function [Gryllus bimaculatus]|nr:Protein of unknown function [Gryllus bimaculatus]
MTLIFFALRLLYLLDESINSLFTIKTDEQCTHKVTCFVQGRRVGGAGGGGESGEEARARELRPQRALAAAAETQEHVIDVLPLDDGAVVLCNRRWKKRHRVEDEKEEAGLRGGSGGGGGGGRSGGGGGSMGAEATPEGSSGGGAGAGRAGGGGDVLAATPEAQEDVFGPLSRAPLRHVGLDCNRGAPSAGRPPLARWPAPRHAP